jgi:hypothetical protein
MTVPIPGAPLSAMPRSLPFRSPRLLLLPNHAMRARRCPRMIAVLWLWEALLGAALAWPFAAIVRAAYGSHPRGDEVLWEPGALPLLDLLMRRLPMLGSLFAHAAIVVLFALVFGLLPLAATLVCVGFTTPDRKPPSIITCFQRAVPALGPLLVLLVITLAFQASLVAASLTGAGLADRGFQRALGEVMADCLAFVIAFAGLFAVAVAGVLEDIARAAVIRYGSGAAEGLRTAWSTMARAPLALTWSWGWRSLASLVPVAFGVLLAGRLGGRGGTGLIVLFGIHQLIVASRAALRVSWLAKATRAVDATGAAPQRLSDR